MNNRQRIRGRVFPFNLYPGGAFEALPQETCSFQPWVSEDLARSDEAIPTRAKLTNTICGPKSYTFRCENFRTGIFKTAMIELNLQKGHPPITGCRKAFRKSSVIFVTSEKSAST